MVKLLIERGADVNAKTNTGATALKGASVEGHLSVVKALVEAGADVKIKDNQGKTASETAKAQGKGAIAAYLQTVAGQGGGASTISKTPGSIEGIVVRVDQPDKCLRIRKGPGSSHEKVGCAALNEKVVLTGTVHAGWAELMEPVGGWVTASQIRAEGLARQKLTSTAQKPRRSRSQEKEREGESDSVQSSAGSSNITEYVEQDEAPSGVGVQVSPGLSIGIGGGGIGFGMGGGGFRRR